MERWRGLKAIVQDAVDHGSRAVERLQMAAAKRPFDLLEQIPPISAPVKGVRLVHDTAVSGVHGAIRLVNRVAGSAVDVVLDVASEQKARAAATAAAPPDAEREPPRSAGDSAS